MGTFTAAIFQTGLRERFKTFGVPYRYERLGR
jgi:hypothetical protein